MFHFQEKETIRNELYDTVNLRYEADFEVEVDEDVFWVPVNRLGKTRYTNDEIKQLLCLSPEEKREKIDNLYEAIQLYQIGNFRGVFDNERSDMKKTDTTLGTQYCQWHYHKPGFHAIRTNEGCCAADSNWLLYLLQGKYEQMGIFQYSQKDTNGHLINFIFHHGWYYFIDMMMYRTDSLPFAGVETGTQKGYQGDNIAGNFFKCRSPVSYVNFCLKQHKDPPVFFAISPEREAYAIGVDFVGDIKKGTLDSMDILYPSAMSKSVVVLYQKKDFPLNLRFEEPFPFEPKWDAIPTNQF